jgi:pyridoxal phosphate enzyme (YggS family)
MTELSLINNNVTNLLRELPPGILVVAAAKSRPPQEINAAIQAGIRAIGENYIQETEAVHSTIGNAAQWHFIGHLQQNKVNKAARLFDMVETIDSLETARALDRAAGEQSKVMPVLIEVNSGREAQKSGVLPEEAESLFRDLISFPNLRVQGLMTMGPATGSIPDLRAAFRETGTIFKRLKALGLPGADIRWLSMGMSDSYEIALEEEANIIRLGSRIFGPRS